MKRGIIRTVILFGLISMAGIAMVQYYWFNKAFDVEEQQFNHQVEVALRASAERLLAYNHKPIPITNPVEQLSSNYFAVRVDDQIDAGVLEEILINEFIQRELHLNFEYGIYDCQHKKMVYGNLIKLKNEEVYQSNMSSMPRWEDNDYYFGVYFPDKQVRLIANMQIWIFSTVMLGVVMLFFAIAMMVILKQRRLSQTQKDFVNNITHELKTPISTIEISSGVLAGENIANSPERLRHYANIVKSEIQTLRGHIEMILNVSLMDEEKRTLQRQKVDIHKVILQQVDNFKILYPEKHHIIVQLLAEKCCVLGDPFHLTNAVNNIIDNAIKYAGEPFELVINTSNEGKKIKITFADTGLGIAPSEKKKIFRKFYRAPQKGVATKGFGLGLYYVKKYLKWQGGIVKVDDNQPQGTIFTILINTTDE